MAERTLAEVETANRPSMVPGAPTEAYATFLDVRGPYKVETRYYQQDAANDFAADDTFTSRLAHPLFVTVRPGWDWADTGNYHPSADLNSDESAADFRQVTLRDAEDVDGVGIVIEVYGF